MPSKNTIVVPLAEAADVRGKTVSGLTYYTSGDGVGFALKCQCGKAHTLTDSVVEHIKKDLEEEAKKARPKMELSSTTFDRIKVGELLVATTDENGHDYPLNSPLLKIHEKRDGGYCLAFPGADYRGQKIEYFFQANRMQVNVYRIKAVNKAFVDVWAKQKQLKKFFSDIPVKKL